MLVSFPDHTSHKEGDIGTSSVFCKLSSHVTKINAVCIQLCGGAHNRGIAQPLMFLDPFLEFVRGGVHEQDYIMSLYSYSVD